MITLTLVDRRLFDRPAAVTGFPNGDHWVVRSHAIHQLLQLPLLVLLSFRTHPSADLLGRIVLARALPGLHPRFRLLQHNQTVRPPPPHFVFPPIYLNLIVLDTDSYHYWKLNPDQETVEKHMSPPDPIERAREAVTSSSRESGDAGPSGGGGGGEKPRLGNSEDNWRMREKNDSPV